MKSTTFFCALSFAIAAVEAIPRDSNAHRLARGLPPLPPRRRQPGAKRSTPSSTPVTCASKKTFCCSDLTETSSSAATNILSGLGIPVSSCGAHVGTGCIAAVGDICLIGTPANFCLDVDLAYRIVLVFTPRIVSFGLVLGPLEQHRQQLCAILVVGFAFEQLGIVCVCVCLSLVLVG
ncbi:hypothetical protein DFH09DRAFT_1322083 [Mycena vulgaris]|nr:hypothetical protein DFH09DRAFT_1322083 [Mycena vulgaris]